MDIKFTPSALHGSIEAASSKSELQRLIIAASLCESRTVIKCNCIIAELEKTIECLNSLGADISFNEEEIVVEPIKIKEKSVELDCGDSTLLVRFLIPIVASLGFNASFSSSGAPISKPVIPLRNEMQNSGVSFSAPWKYPLEISGKLQAGEFKLSGAMSSQYATGLLFALPIVDGDSVIYLSDDTEYKNYIDMTVDILKNFGIKIEEKNNCLYIKGKQKYISPNEIQAKGDWLSSAYLLSAAAVSGEVSVTGLDLSSYQTEKRITEILKSFGAEVTLSEERVTVKANKLSGIQLDAGNIFEIIPALAALSTQCKEGLSVFSNVKQYRFNGRDAMTVISDCLCAIGSAGASTDDGLIVWSGENIVGGEITSFGSSKLVMAMAVAVCGSSSDITVKNAECINKMNPAFLENYKKLGGVYNVINN